MVLTQEERHTKDMKEPLVSVILAAYNTAAYLRKTLASVLNQSYTNYEVVIVDDGSTDNTRAVAEEFIDDKRVRYHYQKNQGVSAARNFAASQARGKYLAMCDADDIWHPKKLAKQMRAFGEDPDLGVVYCNIGTIDEQGNILKPHSNRYKCYSGWVTRNLILRNFVPGPTTVIRKAFFDEVGGFNTKLRLSEDYDLWLRLSTVCRFQHVDETLYLYRKHSMQNSASHAQELLKAHIRVVENFSERFPSHTTSRLTNRAIAETRKNLGHFYLKQLKDPQLARQAFRDAIRTSPLYFSAWNRLIKSYFVSV